jgi:hypothetical protein
LYERIEQIDRKDAVDDSPICQKKVTVHDLPESISTKIPDGIRPEIDQLDTTVF